MSNRFVPVLSHGLMLAAVCGIAAYWGQRILAPQPTAIQPPMTSAAPREPDPALAARMFGLVEQPATRMAMNIEVTGVFAAGIDSSAILAVDGKPARVYLLGQNVASGTRLVEVLADSVIIESNGGRQELRLPPRPLTNSVASLQTKAHSSDRGSLVSHAAAASALPSSAADASPLRPPTTTPQAVQESEQPQLGVSPQPATSGDVSDSVAPTTAPRPPRPPSSSSESRRPGRAQPPQH